MAVLAWGTSTAELLSTSSLPSGVTVQTTSTKISPNVLEGVDVTNQSGANLISTAWTAAAEIWLSAYLYQQQSYLTSATPIIQFFSGATGLFRLFVDAAGSAWRLEYWNGSAWTAAFTAVATPSPNTRNRIDIRIKMDNTVGALELYVNGVLAGTAYAGDTIWTAATTIDAAKFAWGYPDSSTFSTWSAIFVASEDTRTISYIQKGVSGVGGATDWTGAYTTVDETGFDDTDLIQSGTNGHVSTFAKTALPAGFNTGYDVIGVGVSARARKGTTGPANLQLASRSSSTVGVSSSKALTTAFAPYQDIFTLDPNTSAAWTYANADSSQIGVKAIT